MRRSRQGRIINWTLIFVIYCSIQVYSATTKSSIVEDVDTTATELANEFSSILPPNVKLEEQVSSTEPTTTTHESPHPTYRMKRPNCTPPAIEQFPKPLMPPEWRKNGGLVINVIIALFTFLGLAIVCDDYFVSSLDRICEELKLSPDVAGATFMAAGSSAPELATVIIGVFFAKDDIGVSGVIGSAVFNIMFVISVCALCSGTVCHLNWWPLVRDCFFYSLSILVMLIVICNDYITWYEALIMMLFYVVYCIALYFNTSLEKWAHSLQLPIKLPTKEEQSALVTYKNVPDTSYSQTGQAVTSLSQEPTAPSQSQDNYQGYSEPNPYETNWDPNAAWGEPTNITAPAVTNIGWTEPTANSWGDTTVNSGWDQGQQNMGYNLGEDPSDQKHETAIDVSQQKAVNDKTQMVGKPADAEYYKSKDPKSQDIVNPLEKPVDGGLPAVISWGIVYPIHYMCRLTMPDCRTEKYRNWYAFTFLISMVWISFYAFFMVWQITIIGTTMGIPDTVMGLTFVAAGVSVPDALSSIAVIKEGYGDMAVSNAVGSNVFDILICLGLPWFIQTTMIHPGGHVNVISKGLTYSTLSLLSTVVFLLLSVHLNGWKLDRRLGIILMIWYLLFITIASMYELNVFGDFNPKECSTKY
ncbi:probable sodium/potassium/calcium exchanger CG1090 [Bradysia coprophila]|uniref:probable sodium/potassium/calcium exchanger CG1090 n=1 Tax=Bradysia coprophila TaxID=38358 RepID=UPI00187D8F95|nr:probable sodium/potassium/calcium exchanger CG1090 [Bradysia coprophila]